MKRRLVADDPKASGPGSAQGNVIVEGMRARAWDELASLH
jgi:hypothetical protein